MTCLYDCVVCSVEEVRQEAFGVRTELDAMSANMKQVSANLRLKEAVSLS